ncbi:glycosyltransferase family 4 protein [Nocardia sp. 004]|uniref:glycosyltransferase family 4 protein n=1 Tax=Nocardia sp. 004 TaxID=3385978 RepID=UPI0039A2FAE8
MASSDYPQSDYLRIDHSSGPFRIAMVVPPYFDVPPKAYGGVEAVVADLVDSLVDRGHEVTLLGAGESGTKAKFMPVWDRAVPERLGEPFPEVVHALRVRRAIEELAATSSVDLVHDHTFAGPLNAFAFQQLGLPTVLTVHGPIEDDIYRYYRDLGDEVALVAISDRQRELASGLNWSGRVHNALNVDDWPFRVEKDDYALFLGRFNECKAPHLALEAAHAAGIPLVLAGKCSERTEQAYFEEKVRPLLTDNDHLFGLADTSAKRKLLANARCLLFPIRWEEPFGMVMIESMVCGTPVVALRGGAVSEVIVDGVTGRICDDPAELPEAIEAVKEMDPIACRAHVQAKFGSDTLGFGYEQVYRRLLRAKKRFGAVPVDAKPIDAEPVDTTMPVPTSIRVAASGLA